MHCFGALFHHIIELTLLLHIKYVVIFVVIFEEIASNC